jgi:hypothetical protein
MNSVTKKQLGFLGPLIHKEKKINMSSR